MKREACFSLASKGFLTGAVAMLIMGADSPMSEPLSQAQKESVERIRMYDAQPIEFAQNRQAPRPLEYAQPAVQQRWVF